MEYKELEELFEKENFDILEPESGHQERFLQKMQAQKQPVTPKTKIRKLFLPVFSIAACFLLVALLIGSFARNETFAKSQGLATVSPKMKETQQFYNTLIKSELEKVSEEKTPETEKLVNDALIQLEKLDVEYNKLKNDLVKSGKDKRVIFAMVSNLQARIDLLKNVYSQIENIKELNNQHHENNII